MDLRHPLVVYGFTLALPLHTPNNIRPRTITTAIPHLWGDIHMYNTEKEVLYIYLIFTEICILTTHLTHNTFLNISHYCTESDKYITTRTTTLNPLLLMVDN